MPKSLAVRGSLDPVIRATRTIKEYAPLFLRHHQVEGNTKDTYADTLRLHVIPFLGGCRLAETDRTVARNFITALVGGRAFSEHDPAGQGGGRRDVRHGGGGRIPRLQPVP